MESQKIEKTIVTLLKLLGEDTTRPGLRDTPERVAQMYQEFLAGGTIDPKTVLYATFEEKYDGLIIARDLSFASICEHHLLPFFGVAHIAYVPNGRVVGMSKLARALDILAARLQMQERLTEQLADAILQSIEPDAVGIVIEAQHLCMIMRGVKKPTSLIITTTARGPFQHGIITQADILDRLHRR